ncbi:MAG: cytochrome c oxidase subunit 4 [Chloroflexota bacterium]|nr:cytochrome c oxidase subunit 4 [Chloroflexota bacterium]MDE3193294.1 cytochrome c oxidase subunit 4 [Chloroflexota bacterium]
MTHEPAPTAWPAALALGVTLAALGVATSWLLIVAGALLAVIALAGWIVDMTREQEAEHR